jgi:hypothetical protein
MPLYPTLSPLRGARERKDRSGFALRESDDPLGVAGRGRERIAPASR